MSTTTKHTRGPWTCEDRGDRFHIMGREDWIATVISGYDGDEQNARLIASAPELLEALEGIREWWLNATAIVNDKDELEMPTPIFDGMLRAIAKATGKE